MTSPTRQVGAIVLLIASVGSQVDVRAEGPRESPAPLRTFKSETGGFRVKVPESWHVKEVPQADGYQAFLSRERVEQKGDLYTYGLSVLRLRDYRSVFTFKAEQADAVVLEYATRVASGLAGGGRATVASLYTGDYGLELKWVMFMAGQGAECVKGNLLMRVEEKEWFSALWEAPCSEAEADTRSAEIVKMMRSLHVKERWGATEP